jgi:hypothetical protein
LVWATYWIALAALFVAGIVGLVAGITWVLVVAIAAVLIMPLAAIAIGVRSELRHRRRRDERHGP